jgi:hypothetical protein
VRAPALDPELFYLPLPYGYPGDQYRVTLSYSVPMLFEAGQYVARLPTMLQPACLPSTGVSINSVLKVELTINTGVGAIFLLFPPTLVIACHCLSPGCVCLGV